MHAVITPRMPPALIVPVELLKLPAARSANVTASETNSAMNETFLRIVAIANRNVTIDQVVRKIPTAEANSAWSVP